MARRKKNNSAVKKRQFNVAALFAGIAGIELGLKQAGHKTVLFCENDPAALAVLKKHRRRFPDVAFHEDVQSLEDLPESVDLLTAGFPCQDLSQAGKTNGIDGKQSSLVSHVFRLLHDFDIPWLLLENVPFMLQLDRGAAMRYLIEKLESKDLGYRWAYRIVDSRAFGVPQRRQRVYLLASRVDDPARYLFKSSYSPIEATNQRDHACGFYWTEGTRGLGWAVDAVPTLKRGSSLGIASPPAIWLPDGRIGTPDIRDAERLQGFAENWTEPAENGHRPAYRWSLVGNAVTTLAAAWVGRCLAEGPGDPVALDMALDIDPDSPWPKAACGGPGEHRRRIACTMWPERKPSPALVEFLKHPVRPLSAKATKGFFDRLKKSSLKRPPEFDKDLAKHLARMSTGSARPALASTRPD